MKVVAGQDLPQGATSYDISINPVSSALTTKVITLKQTAQGRITCGDDETLVHHIKFSDDIHGCNCVLERGSIAGTVRLHTTRTIRKGDEMYMWFTQDLLAAMDIPFLNPINILGEKNYTCHRCGRTFEFPNPLKIHLGLDCGVLKRRDLWKRLRASLSINAPREGPEFIFRLSLKKRKPALSDIKNYKSPSPVFSSYSNPSPDRCEPQTEETRPSSEPPRSSAFRPYLNPPPTEEFKEISLFEKEPMMNVERVQIPELVTKEHYLNQQAAEIETLVSNLGQSKQGHLCLYCGKIYSRKYGLKIHIRTHTGFKPLKCKFCLRPFGDPSNLNKHVRLHADTDTPYRCRLCGKMLVRRRDLERHMKSRHDVEEDF
ncbi:MDS1 and EVI1 complex locus protein EVI1-A [Cimex lectularius]|uniref:C2H2-type domain-containing protein n=1 Tax=Cimex lectularius TaxID=79782 RepID=A0A8I6RYX1_CIMLE|nr:MDS1 and EVI1 complex locus protein EVI1-A [Cimex lectularius]